MGTQVSLTLPAGGAQSIAIAPRPAATPPGTPGADTQPAVETQQPQQSQQAKTPPDAKQLNEALDSINQKLQDSDQQLRFALDKDSGRMVVRVVDTATDQVIRQIPSEVAIQIGQSLEKLHGLLVRQQA
jgi:flagellar protein FlaG